MRKMYRCLPPFEMFYSGGPSFNEKLGRYVLSITSVDDYNKSTTLLYSRYLYCVSKGVSLPSHIHVDHIDNDRTNDTLQNLQELSSTDNLIKQSAHSVYMAKKLTTDCPVCGVTFTRALNNTPHGGKPGKTMFCSKKCSDMGNGKKLINAWYEISKPIERKAYKMEPWSSFRGELFVSRRKMLSNSKQSLPCKQCGEMFNPPRKSSVFCSTHCAASHRHIVARPTKEEILEKLEDLGSFVALGKHYGVSDNAVRKWLRK